MLLLWAGYRFPEHKKLQRCWWFFAAWQMEEPFAKRRHRHRQQARDQHRQLGRRPWIHGFRSGQYGWSYLWPRSENQQWQQQYCRPKRPQNFHETRHDGQEPAFIARRTSKGQALVEWARLEWVVVQFHVILISSISYDQIPILPPTSIDYPAGPCIPACDNWFRPHI